MGSGFLICLWKCWFGDDFLGDASEYNEFDENMEHVPFDADYLVTHPLPGQLRQAEIRVSHVAGIEVRRRS
jgi:hypothetical protein